MFSVTCKPEVNDLILEINIDYFFHFYWLFFLLKKSQKFCHEIRHSEKNEISCQGILCLKHPLKFIRYNEK